MSDKLKVGVVIDSNTVKSFEYKVLEDLNSSKSCKLSVLINSGDENSELNLLLNGYLKIDAKINSRGKNHISKKSIEDLNIDVVSDLTQEFDILINFSNKNISDMTNLRSKYGIWELRYGEAQYGADMAGVKEVFESTDTTTIMLTANEYIIDKFICATHALSPVRNRSDIVFRSYILLLRNIEKLAVKRDDFVEAKSQNLYFVKDKEIKSLKFLETLCLITKLGFKNITSRFDKLFRKQQWSIYYAVNHKGTAFNKNLSDFKEIPTPKEFFWADPFVVDKDDKSYIFFEEYVYKTHKGHLSVIEYDHKTAQFSETKEILNTSYHLSYPFIMEYEGEFYMIPEGSADGDVKLYRAVNFPYQWEVVRTLMEDVIAVDTTLFYKDDTWWMFTNIAEYEGVSFNEELYIYHCKDFLKDEWIPHIQNPVVSSLQTSRPAGGIIEYNGSLYRPSQNSVGWYGRSTNFNKILILTPDVYKEEFVSEITPDLVGGIYAVHTYNSSKKLTVIDGLRKIGRFF